MHNNNVQRSDPVIGVTRENFPGNGEQNSKCIEREIERERRWEYRKTQATDRITSGGYLTTRLMSGS